MVKLNILTVKQLASLPLSPCLWHMQLLCHFMSWQSKYVYVLGQNQITGCFSFQFWWKKLKYCDFQYSANFSLWLTQTVKSWQINTLSTLSSRSIPLAESIGAFNEEIKLQQKFSARFQSCVHLCYHHASSILVLFTLQKKNIKFKEKNYFFSRPVYLIGLRNTTFIFPFALWSNAKDVTDAV